MLAPINWLLDGPPYIQFRTRMDLLRQSVDDPVVITARKATLAQPEVTALQNNLMMDWPGKVLSSHKSANQSFHTLNFLADIGIKANDPGMETIISKILASASPEGPFRLQMNISQGHGGTGEVTGAWALCDAPNQVYALMKLGMTDHPRVQKAYEYLVSLINENGWPCAVSPELGTFHGPGRKSDPCPYANLAMLKILGLTDDGRTHPAAKTGAETLLDLWQNRRESHPYIFYMGTDFCKLKAPLIWYDILHVLDVLSHFPHIHQDGRFQDMLVTAMNKMNSDGTFTPESIYNPYKSWDFGQKKEPSRWITMIMWRISSLVDTKKFSF